MYILEGTDKSAVTVNDYQTSDHNKTLDWKIKEYRGFKTYIT